MSPLTECALRAIADRINLATGLTHPDDYRSVRELLARLHLAGESLDPVELVAWAETNDWQPRDARQLGKLVVKLACARQLRVAAEWWKPDILDLLRAEIEASTAETTSVQTAIS